MQVREAGGRLLRHAQHLVQREAPLSAPRAERLTADVVHDQDGAAIDLGLAERSHDVGVVEVAQQRAGEAVAGQIGLRRGRGGQDFEDDGEPVPLPDAAKDGRARASRDLLAQPIAVDVNHARSSSLLRWRSASARSISERIPRASPAT